MQSLSLPALPLPLSLCPALAWSSCSSEFLLILFIGRTLPSPSQSPWQSQPLLRSQFVSWQPRPALPPSLGACLLGQLIEIFIYSLFFCLCQQQQLGGFSYPALAIFITAFFSQPSPSPPLVLVKFALGLCRVASITARRIVLDAAAAQTKVLALARADGSVLSPNGTRYLCQQQVACI